MANKTYFGVEARAKLMAGIEVVKKTVAPTLGASGRNICYNKWTRVPILSNDGVKGAREVEPEDLAERQGANLIKQVSENTNDEANDGTTTSIILAHSIIEQGMKLLSSPDNKVNAMKLRREIKQATLKVIEALEASVTPVSTLADLENIAAISVEDAVIGKIIAKAIHDAGENGIVYVNESTEVGVTIEKGQGYQFQQGLISPYLITNPERMETVLENAAVFMTEAPLHLNNEFISMIDTIILGAKGPNNTRIRTGNETKNILIICDEFHPDILKYAVANLYPRDTQGNMMPSKFIMSMVKKPMQANSLEDIQSIVGGVAMTKDSGLVKPAVEYVGRCQKVIINRDTTTIFDGMNVEGAAKHVENLKSQIVLADEENDDNKKTKLQERIAKLTSGVYYLNVGDKTEAESRYLKDKVDDAVGATKAAKESGIVAGGGMALFHIAQKLFSEDMNDGQTIIYNACMAPLKQILENSGVPEHLKSVEQSPEPNNGYDALNDVIVDDMFEAGIIDPLKVTKTAFQNASSFAGLILTTETLITPIPSAEDSQK